MLGHGALCEFPLAGYGPASTHVQASITGVSANTVAGNVQVAISGWVSPPDQSNADWDAVNNSGAEWEDKGDPSQAEWEESGNSCGGN